MVADKAHTRRRILQALDKPLTAPELQAKVHAHINHVRRVLRELHDSGEIHVAEWKGTKTRHAPVWLAGPGTDAPKPPGKTSNERYKLMLERMTADNRDRYRNRNNTKRRKIKPDPLVQQFFGGER